MEGIGYKPTVSSSYVSYLRSLLDKLYNAGYSAIPNAEELFNVAATYPLLMKGLLEYINDVIKKAFADSNCPISQKQLNNGRSAFRKFVEFILGHSATVNLNVQSAGQSTSKPMPNYFKPTKTYQNMMGWKIYSKDDIVRIIKSRLGTQDRLSGSKVWLPIRIVKELLGSGWFDVWCKDIIDNTKVFVDNNGRYLMLGQVDEMRLKPDINGLFSVWVVVGGQEHRVYTRTSKGTFVPMFVKGIEGISLEHSNPIHNTLTKLGNQNKLPELSKISDIAKQVSRAIKSSDGAKIKKNITVNQNQISSNNPPVSALIDLDELRKEMDLIKDDTDYELMEVKQNIINGARGSSTTSGTPLPISPAPIGTTTTVITKKSLGSTSGSSVMKIGQYARQTITDLLKTKQLTSTEITHLEDPVFCKNKLGMNYPVLVDVTKSGYNSDRYYKQDRSIAPYVICNDWYERNRTRFDAWLKTI